MKHYEYQHWNGLILALGILACARALPAQVAAPQTMGVYGGIMSYIVALSNDAATTRVYVSADSAAAVFYADVDFSKSNPFGTNLMFQPVPGLTSADNRGMPNGLAVHKASGRLFVSTPSVGLLSCTVSSNSLVTNVPANVVWGMVIEGSHLVYVMNDNHTVKLGYGTLSTNGGFTDAGSPATVMATDFDAAYNTSLGVHPTNHIVYLSGLGNTNIVRSSDSIENLSAGTVFTPLVLPSLTTNWTCDPVSPINDRITFGFGPDGRIFIGGYNPANTNLFTNRGWELTYSDDNGVTWSPVITGGSGSRVWSTVGDPANYWVYNGSSVSTNKGVNWQAFGTCVPGARVGTMGSHHANRRVVADPTHSLVLYIATQCGFGVCTNGGMTDNLDTILNISRGIEAAVVNDFDLTADKNIAWVAANGIRRATNFQGTPEWSDPKFPMNNDGCLYVAVDKSDTNGLTVYAGGGSLYKTINGGPVESDPNNPTNWTAVFHPINYGFNDVRVSAIEADGNIVAFGLRGTAGNKGALFLSTDGGSNWQEVVLHPDGVDVTELLLTREGGSDVVYATVANDYLTTAYGVFKINIADVTITHELTDTVNMHDLAVASDGRLYASGFDAQTNVVLYSKSAGTAVWTAIPLDGYPRTTMLAMRLDVPLVTVGLDSSSNEVPYMLGYQPGYVAYYAIYYMITTGTNVTWETSAALCYPDALQIKVLFWDDLVVGTSMGLYGQRFQPNASVENDFDGDGKSDLAVYRNGYWSIFSLVNGVILANVGEWGGADWTALPGDYDGDGKTDLAVYRAGYWSIFSLVNGMILGNVGEWGGAGWTPVPGDYDGDGKSDLAVYRNGYWSIFSLVNGLILANAGEWGGAGWTAVPGDYDGDGRSDLAVYRNGYWSIFSLVNGVILANVGEWGGADWIPVPGDYDGDGKADLAVYRNGYWSIFSLANGVILANTGEWGGADWIPVPGDYDGDGKSDLAVYRNGYWSIFSLVNGVILANTGEWGGPGWTPVK